MDTCSECKTGSLSSFFESRLGVCADCCAKFVDMARELEKRVPEMLKAIQDAKDFQKLVEDINDVEKRGYEASLKGFGSDQNPLRGMTHEKVWDSGWSRGELERRTAQAVVVMEWSVLNLRQISELALGLGALEIASKLDTVVEKISPFVVPE